MSSDPSSPASPAVSFAPSVSPSFIAPKNRDAWSTIRGFVFQADLTIERWLHLGEDQELQLECGEDIDTVTRYIATGEEQRLLEQIKHRDENVTLKSNSALAALANAVEHRRNNPSVNLLFRYTTNASVGCERLSPFPSKVSAIEIWQRLQTEGREALSEDESSLLVSNIKRLLSGATRPENDVSQDIWDRFKNFLAVSSDDEIRNFINIFEWSVGSTSASEMSDVIQQALLDQGHAADPLAAYVQYQKLFLIVMKTLSEHSGKRLTQTDLVAAIQQPISANDREAFENFLKEMSLLDRKLSYLQAQFSRQEQVLGGMAVKVERLLDIGRTQTLNLNAPIPIFEPPPIEAYLSPRALTVDSLTYELSQATWLALTGSSGTGKTHLALFLATKFRECQIWLRFRDMDVEQAAATFDSVFLYLNEGRSLANRHAWYVEVCRRFGNDSLFVLDDLPAMISGDALTQRLESLTRACRDAGTKLVTTSVHRLPGSISRVAQGTIIQKDAPPLTDIEAMEILSGLDAPPALLGDTKKVRFLNNVARKHPTLLSAVAAYLRSQGWDWKDEQLGALMQSRFAAEVNDETIRRLLATVADDRSRDLLYRLNLVLGTFDLDTVRLLAEVVPPVSSPRERLTSLTGLWIQRDVSDSLRVSPLIGALGSDDLDPAVLRSCRHALGRKILQRGTISFSEIREGINYLASAGEHEEAVTVLCIALGQALSALNSGDLTLKQVEQTGILGLYGSVPFPSTVSLTYQLILRSNQLVLCDKMKKDSSDYVGDLIRLIDLSGKPEAIGLFAAAVYNAAKLAEIDFDASCRCIVKAASFYEGATLEDGSSFYLPDRFTSGTLLWVNLIGIRSKADVLRWCRMLDEVPVETKAQALSDEVFADQAASLLIDRFLQVEASLSKDTRRWIQILKDLTEIETVARDSDAGIIIAAAIRAKVLILCERLQEPDRAIDVARIGLSGLTVDARSVFLIADAIGRKLSYLDGREAEAKFWLEKAESACERVPNALRWERAITLLALGRLADKRGEAGQVCTFISRAVELTRSSAHYPEIELVKFLGDLALAHWSHGDPRSAFNAFDEAISRFVRLKADTQEWKALFILFGHTAGYMLSMTATGHPPVLEGDIEPYVLPPVGNFHDYKETLLAARYREDFELVLPAQMSGFAEALGQDDRVAYWAEQVIRLGKYSRTTAMVVSTTFFDMLPHLVRGRRFAEVFDGCREAALTTVAASILLRQGDRDGTFLKEINVHEILGQLGSDDWKDAELRALNTTVVPLALHLALLTIRARTDPAAADDLMRDGGAIDALCLEAAAISSLSEAWHEVALLFRNCYLNQSTSATVIDHANQYTHEGVRAVAYLGASLHRAVDVRDACRDHVTVLPFCLLNLVSEGGYRLLLLPFVQEYWTQAVMLRRFAFTPPQLVEEQIRASTGNPERERAKRILEIIASGVGVTHDVSVLHGFRNWDQADARVIKKAP